MAHPPFSQRLWVAPHHDINKLIAMRYFAKSLISNGIPLPNGTTIPFIHIASGYGVIATEDPATIEALDVRVRERRGGVSEINQEAYEEELKKKNASASPLLPPNQLQQRDSISLMEAGRTLHEISQRRSEAPVAESATPAKVDPPKPIEVQAGKNASQSTSDRPLTTKVRRTIP